MIWKKISKKISDFVLVFCVGFCVGLIVGERFGKCAGKCSRTPQLLYYCGKSLNNANQRNKMRINLPVIQNDRQLQM